MTPSFWVPQFPRQHGFCTVDTTWICLVRRQPSKKLIHVHLEARYLEHKGSNQLLTYQYLCGEDIHVGTFALFMHVDSPWIPVSRIVKGHL